MCGKHPNIWMRLKSTLGIDTGKYYSTDVRVCPLCVKLARLEVKSLVKAGGHYERDGE